MAKSHLSTFFSAVTVAFLLATEVPALAMQKPAAQQQAMPPVPNGPPDPAKAPIIDQLFTLTKPDKMMNQMLTQYKAAFSNAAQQGFVTEVRKFDDPSKYRADFEKLQERLFTLMQSQLEWSKLKPQVTKAYSDTFSKDELIGLVSFYKSPAGQAEINKMPQLLAVCSAIGQSHMQGAIPEMQKMMNDDIADLKTKAQANHPTPPASGSKPPAKP